ncbi:uncharacterized protein N7496_012149 [Penicillium cataractarum]|uniref:Uncharacterized protein n=1 Tax=Penicillium cataractarum TaxID=2100454 RepID=A0A9W9RGJ2_9EURO|nr:uncharacterized protein N7496_012149 [Penicillium cataractarum]KAJ5359736.1 hypothetical protein N7496_012149 [Penicillium cataractarum]
MVSLSDLQKAERIHTVVLDQPTSSITGTRSTMKLLWTLSFSLVALAASIQSTDSSCDDFPTSTLEFTSEFQQPKPPLVKPEFQTSFIQHKWNNNLSHITSGYIYFSPSQNLVRADEAYDGGLASSIFDYSKTNKEGLVLNKLTSYEVNSTDPTVWMGYVMSNYPLFTEDFLIRGDAVFGGLVKRNLLTKHVASWNLMYSSIPVTVFVDACGVVVGYDYFSPGLRTRVVTDFFNIAIGPVKV